MPGAFDGQEGPRLTFGGAEFYLLIPEVNKEAPKPRPQSNVRSVDIPYGGTVFIRPPGSFKTAWTPDGGIQIVSTTAYNTIDGLYDQFASLLTPWGTFTAHLFELNVVYVRTRGTWEGTASWQWA